MAREFAKAFYHSSAWRRNQAAYMRRAVETPFGTVPPYMCERCYEQGRLVPAKVVHHKVHLNPNNITNPEITLSFNNFMRLCQDCHAAVHSGTEAPRCSFDEHGNVIRREQ